MDFLHSSQVFLSVEQSLMNIKKKYNLRYKLFHLFFICPNFIQHFFDMFETISYSKKWILCQILVA